jgi:nitrilase
MNSGDDKQTNLQAAERSIKELAARGAQLIMLPEHFNFLGPERLQRKNAEPLDQSPSLDRIRNLATQLKVAVHIGSYLERKEERLFNTGVVFDHNGKRIARYRKIHLFDVEIPGGKSYRESDTISPGNEVVTFPFGDFRFGMATCYDLRFPELFRRLGEMAADVILLPAAFTLQTWQGPLGTIASGPCRGKSLLGRCCWTMGFLPPRSYNLWQKYGHQPMGTCGQSGTGWGVDYNCRTGS